MLTQIVWIIRVVRVPFCQMPRDSREEVVNKATGLPFRELINYYCSIKQKPNKVNDKAAKIDSQTFPNGPVAEI